MESGNLATWLQFFFPQTPPHIPFYPRSQKVKIQLFRNMVMLDIKLTGIINAATWQQIFCPQNLSPTTLGAGSKGQNSTFSEHGHVAYQIIENHECSNMVANILPKDPHSQPLGMGSIGQNSIFSGHCHVAYQIIENHECSIMVANILLADPPPPPLRPDPGSGVNMSEFNLQNMVIWHIKLTGIMKHVSKCFAHIPPSPLP